MRILAAMLLVCVVSACADMPRVFKLDPYEPWKKEQKK